MKYFKELVMETMEDNPELTWDQAETKALEDLIEWAESYEPKENGKVKQK